MIIKKGKNNWNYLLIVIFLAAIFGGGILWLTAREEPFFTESSGINKKGEVRKNYSESDKFRNLCIKFIREEAENYFGRGPVQHPEELAIRGNWETSVTLYCQGEIKGEGQGKDEILSFALEEATKNILGDKRAKKLTEEELKEGRFLVRLLYPPNQFSFIEYQGEGKELVGDLTAIRNLDKDIIHQKIKEGKEFLYQMMDEEEKGFHKYYYALDDEFENRLHTVYSASIIYTFLYLYDFKKDKEILEYLPGWGDFLLSMQDKEVGSQSYGAFHYSYFLKNRKKETRFHVGTSALSIFTLLRLYNLTGKEKYLKSAKLAGDWLITMQKSDGSMKPYLVYGDGQWTYGQKESLLYNGQVLSALSKLYQATEDERYYEVAEKIAQRFTEKYEKEQGYIEGEYRKKNPISNAWVVMSLMDFYKTNQDDYYKNIIFELSGKILEKQKNNTNDLLYYGGWDGAYSTSGMGWISEVMTETYRFCQTEGREDCEKYKDSVIKAIRWIIQNTYSEENSFFLKNSERAIGGVFWNQSNRYVRTDSVCHALNGYIRIFNYLDEGLLLSIPEKPFEEILEELKK